MMHHHKWSLHDIENLLPWERDIYLYKLSQWVEEENDRTKEYNRKIKGG